MGIENTRKPKEGWRQLDFKTTICLPNEKCAAVAFFIIFIATLILTSVILSFSYKISEHSSKIIDFPNRIITDTIWIDTEIESPVFIYLEYINYFQNNRIYQKSKSKAQLAGKSDSALSTSCSPLVNYGDLGFTFNQDKSGPIVPCGLRPASYYIMTFSLNNTTGSGVNIRDTDIVWPYDDSSMYKNSPEQYVNITDPHFKVWMRAGLSGTFRKLYGKIDGDLPRGNYTFTLESLNENWLGYEPDMRIIISNATRIGGKNMVLGWTFFVIMMLSLIWCLFFGISYLRKNTQ